MPVEYTGFLLAPFGFFDRNPALDVPRARPLPRLRGSDPWGNGPAKSCKRAHDNYVAAAQEAGRTGDWRPWAEMFTEDAQYIEHHYGTFDGREAIHDVDRARRWRSGRTPR